MICLKRIFVFVLLFFSIMVLAEVYGPFRCDNGCNAREMTDLGTIAFIKKTINPYLNNQAREMGKEFRWKPGDELTICDGSWCVTSWFHPLTGIFIWNPKSRPAYKDNGQLSKNEVHGLYLEGQRNPEFAGLLVRLAGMCLKGMLNYGGGYIEGGDSYSYDGTYLTVTSNYRDFSLGADFCNL